MTLPISRYFVGPSITYWVRVEPDPRSDATDALIVPLQARVRDPMWFLTRQWQLGEFQGADAGSPAYVALTERTGKMSSWSVAGGTPTAIGVAPLERETEREAFSPDLATRVELGQTFEALPEVIEAVGGKVPTIVDSGFRRGSDIFTALALGADGEPGEGDGPCASICGDRALPIPSARARQG